MAANDEPMFNDQGKLEMRSLGEQLSELIRTIASLDQEPLWTSHDIAKFFQVSEASVSKNYYYIPGFPKGFRLPSAKGLGGRRWYGKDIRDWCDRQKEQ